MSVPDRRSTVVMMVVLLLAATGVLAAGVMLVARAGGGNDATAAGEQAAEGISVHDAWMAPNQGATAVYLTIDNGGADDRLVGASTDVAEAAVLMGATANVAHTAGGDGPVSLDVPAGTTELRAGESHLMLQDLTGPLAPGTPFRLRLDFDRAGTVETEVEVVSWDEVARRSG